MKHLSTTLLFVIALCTIGFAQQRRTVGLSSEDKPGMTIAVSDSKTDAHLADAKVLVVIGKDSIRLKTDQEGIAFYGGAIKKPNVFITVSHPGYVTKTDTTILRIPPTQDTRMGVYIRLKKADPEDNTTNKSLD